MRKDTPYSLVPLTGVANGLITMGSNPAWITVANGAMSSIGLANAMQAVELAARLTTRHHSWLHLGLRKILQFVVNVQVADAAMEAGAIQDLPEAEGSRVHIDRHSWWGKVRVAK